MNLVFGSTPKECKHCFSERNSENNSDFRLSYAIKKKCFTWTFDNSLSV